MHGLPMKPFARLQNHDNLNKTWTANLTVFKHLKPVGEKGGRGSLQNDKNECTQKRCGASRRVLSPVEVLTRFYCGAVAARR